MRVGSTSLKCVVLDISTEGARLVFASPVTLPLSFAVQLRDGATYPAVKRWERGLELGVHFTAPPHPSGDPGQVRRAVEALDALAAVSSTNFLGILRAERFFGDEHLRDAAEALSSAHEHLVDVLRRHAARLTLE